MPEDITQKILAAFQVEYKEHLEGIRALLAKVSSAGDGERVRCLDEAFRMAHSLKGGARVCDLRPVETLAHRLETVFEQVRGSERPLDDGVVRTVGIVLDSIEDWMTGFECGDRSADPAEALAAVERLLQSAVTDADFGPTVNVGDDVARRILEAFRAECPKYVAELRRLIAELAGDGRTPAVVEEAYRLAHNLRDAAEAAEVESIERIGGELESLMEQFCDSPIAIDPAACDAVRKNLDAVERELHLAGSGVGVGCPEFNFPPDATGHSGMSREKLTSGRPTPGTPSPSTVETVRISTESLDRVLRSSGQLLAHSRYQEQMGGELEAVRRQIAEMDREREAMRRVTAANLHRLSAVSEFNHLVRFLDTIDRGIHSLSRRARRLCRDHKRHSLTLETYGRQLQRDVKHARMVTAESVVPGLRKTVRDLAGQEGKQVELLLDGFDVRADRMVFQALKDPLVHMLRNCISHGIETAAERSAAGKDVVGRVRFQMTTNGNRLVIDVADDGRGLDTGRIAARAVANGLLTEPQLAERTAEEIAALIFLPGFSTSETVTEIAGRGMGLSVVREAVSRLQGEVEVRNNDAGGATFCLSVPLTVSTHRLLLVTVGECSYAVPVLAIDRLLRVNVDELETIEGRPVITFRDQPVPLVSLAHLLGQPGDAITSSERMLHVAVLKSGARRLAVSVDAFHVETELLIQDLDEFAARTEFSGAVIQNDGNVAFVLNPAELLRGYQPSAGKFTVDNAPRPPERRTPRMLVVDDSFTTRTLEKSILEANGYEVAIAVDGVEGLNRLKCETYDLVISDIEMPRMDGFTLLKTIKQDRRLASTPVILVTSRDRPEDRERGLDLGADAYIVKQRFDHQSLLQVIRQIVQ